MGIKTVGAALFGTCALIAGCVRQPDVVRTRHAAETGCSASSIEVSQVGHHQWVATGCGYRAVYICEHRRGPCRIDGAVQDLAPDSRARRPGQQFTYGY